MLLTEINLVRQDFLSPQSLLGCIHLPRVDSSSPRSGEMKQSGGALAEGLESPSPVKSKDKSPVGVCKG